MKIEINKTYELDLFNEYHPLKGYVKYIDEEKIELEIEKDEKPTKICVPISLITHVDDESIWFKQEATKYFNSQLKFYEFSQTNSGGSFIVNNKLCHRIFIEALSADEANLKAESLGCYWYGTSNGKDCRCCGDRWYETSENHTAFSFPFESFKNIEEYAQNLANEFGWTTPDIRIYYKNGSVKEIFSNHRRVNPGQSK